METWILIILYSIVGLLFLLLIDFKWCIRTLRSIASPKNQGGYTKLVQIGLMAFLIIIFTLIVIYYILNPSSVDKIDVILTVIVGWLGLIIGGFFGEKSMETLHEKQEFGVKKAKLVFEEVDNIFKKYDSLISKLLEKIKNLEKK